MKHQKYKVDLSGWELDAVDALKGVLAPIILKAASEALQRVLEDDNETDAYLPIQWDHDECDGFAGTDGMGGPPVEDPLTVYVSLGLHAWDDESEQRPAFRFTLSELVDDTIDGVRERGEKTAPPEHTRPLTKLRDALREQADKIDAIIRRE